jgi:hypothetical protein
MIARVKIAPVERWCEMTRRDALKYPELLRSEGTFVDIETKSMTVNPIKEVEEICDPSARWWQITERSRQEQEAIMQIDTTKEQVGNWVCEHMLEMD